MGRQNQPVIDHSRFPGSKALGVMALLAIAMVASGALAATVGSGQGAARGAAVPATREAVLDVNAERFKPRVLAQISQCLVASRTLRDRIAAHDLAGSQQAWLATRDSWERSEVVTSEFLPDLDRAIDAWPDAQKGFHAIEAKLFGAHNADVLPAAEELVGNLEQFERRLRETPLTAQGLLNGAARLAFEIGEDKASGGESPFSGNSLAEMGSNVEALRVVYTAVFAPVLSRQNAALSGDITQHLSRLRELVAVGNLQQVDPLQLRNLSEGLASDFVGLGRQVGL